MTNQRNSISSSTNSTNPSHSTDPLQPEPEQEQEPELEPEPELELELELGPEPEPETNIESLHHDLFNLSLNSEMETYREAGSSSTNEDPQSSSSSSDNLFHEPPPLSLPPPQSPHSRPPQEILNDISTLALNARITEVALSIQEVALALFQVQELRHSNSSSNTGISSPQTSPSILASDRAGGSALTPVDKALMRLDKKVQTTAQEFSELETIIVPHLSQEARRSGEEYILLKERYDTILEEWKRIQADTQILKDELKEDKWLVVFRAVSGQAEEMMSSLEKVLTVSQEFVREALKRTRRSRPLSNSHHSSSTHSQHQSRNKRESLGSSTSSLDRHDTEELLKSYQALSRNFHAKNKHYVPSCQRVLGILSKGIKSRSTKNGEVLRRYADMNVRFTTIQQMIDKTELDLVTVEKLLQQHVVVAATSDSLSSAHCSIQIDDFSHLQPPLTHTTPGTPSSSSDSKTRKALSSMSNYIMSTSPKFFGASREQQTNGMSSSIPPFKKLASKFTGSAASVSSQPSSTISSIQTPPTLTASTLHHRTTSSQPQPRPLRSMRSTLNMERNPSLNRRQVVSEERPGPSNLLLSESRARPNSRQIFHHTASSEKPRWNISLKRIEDTPTSSHNLNRSTRRASHNLSSSHSRMMGGTAMRASTPSMMHILARQNHPDRPGSVAGRSEASCMTTLSTNLYRSRPPSRHSKIPVPLWDPNMQAQRARSKGSLELQEIVRSESGVCTPNPGRNLYRPSTSLATTRTCNGLFSPTFSDMERMPRKPTASGSGGGETITRTHNSTTRRISRNSSSLVDSNYNHLTGTTKEHLESLIETLELEEKTNPMDPLDTIIHGKCKEKSRLTKIIARRIDPHLSTHHGNGEGKGDLARYSFWFIGLGRPNEEKSVVCKLVNVPTSKLKSLHHPSPDLAPNGNPLHHQQFKVLVKSSFGWLDLDSYINQFLPPNLLNPPSS